MKRTILLTFLVCALLASGQTTKQTVSQAAATVKNTSLPAEATVNEFLRRMFGYDPNVKWQVQNITPAGAPGVAHVFAVINGQQAVHLYVLPGGKFAAVGEPIPFGADPFGPVRDTLAAKAKGTARGATDAPVTIVEFSDLQCPFCKNAQPTIDRLVKEVSGVRLVFQPFPLRQHKWAMKAAGYAECMERERAGAFWDFVNAVYQDQPNITDENVDEKLQGIVAAIGVDAGKVSACSTSSDVQGGIQESIELGKSLGVNSTPTVFLNGRRIQAIGDLRYEQLKAMAEFEVTEARKK